MHSSKYRHRGRSISTLKIATSQITIRLQFSAAFKIRNSVLRRTPRFGGAPKWVNRNDCPTSAVHGHTRKRKYIPAAEQDATNNMLNIRRIGRLFYTARRVGILHDKMPLWPHGRLPWLASIVRGAEWTKWTVMRLHESSVRSELFRFFLFDFFRNQFLRVFAHAHARVRDVHNIYTKKNHIYVYIMYTL